MDEEWMKMREEADNDFRNRITKVLNRAIGSKFSSITFLFDFQWPSINDPGAITIYTTHPGILIGKYGINMSELRDHLRAEFDREFEVKIKEVQYMYKSTFISEIK